MQVNSTKITTCRCKTSNFIIHFTRLEVLSGKFVVEMLEEEEKEEEEEEEEDEKSRRKRRTKTIPRRT